VAFIRTKFINGEYYYYLVAAKRAGGIQRQTVVKYLGGREPAEKYAEAHGLKMPCIREVPERQMESLDKEIAEKFRKLKALRANPVFSEELRREIMEIWTYNSTTIEGSTLTRRETALAIEEGIVSGAKPLTDYLAAKGHASAVDLVYGFVKENRAIDESAILELHRAVMVGIFDVEVVGKYRDVQVWLRGRKYIPLPPEQVPGMMRGMVKQISRTPENLDPVTHSAGIHLNFESIHPFQDGNGRVGRLLSNWMLMRAGYPPIIIMASEKRRYFNALEYGQVRGDPSRLRFLFKRKMRDALDFYLERAGGSADKTSSRRVVPKPSTKKSK